MKAFKFTFTLIVSVLTGLAALALQAQTPTQTQGPQQGYGVFSGSRLPDGIVPWELLMDTRTIQLKNKKYAPEYSDAVKKLNNKPAKLYGYMIPLESGDKQSNFLLAAYPADCPFCLTGGPESLIEIRTSVPITYTEDAIMLSGVMNVLDNDTVYFRMTEAKLAKF